MKPTKATFVVEKKGGQDCDGLNEILVNGKKMCYYSNVSNNNSGNSIDRQNNEIPIAEPSAPLMHNGMFEAKATEMPSGMLETNASAITNGMIETNATEIPSGNGINVIDVTKPLQVAEVTLNNGGVSGVNGLKDLVTKSQKRT